MSALGRVKEGFVDLVEDIKFDGRRISEAACGQSKLRMLIGQKLVCQMNPLMSFAVSQNSDWRNGAQNKFNK